MNEIKNLVKIALDAKRGNVQKYSVDEANDLLRQALIESNGGSTKIDIRKIRDGECGKTFAIIEEIIRNSVPQGLQENDFFTALVDYRNVSEGDEASFDIEDSNLFFVDDAARGTQGVRRQRIGGLETVVVPTKTHVIRIYEELSRILANRADFNVLIDKVDESVRNQILTEIYAMWSAVTSTELGGSVYYPAVGSYSENTLLDIIDHVESASGGKTATLIGTKKAIRNLANSISHEGNLVKDDMYNMGYIGKFFGSPVVVVPQRHKINSTSFVFANDEITIIAGDEKPLKFVYEGDPLILPRDPALNADLTQEYFLAERWGMKYAAAGNSGIGKYKFTP